MKLETFDYVQDKGWSIKSFPQMDSENTLVLIFADPAIIKDPSPIEELVKHYPNSKIIGCSAAGEISGSRIIDNGLSVAVAQFEKTKLKIIKSTIHNPEESYKAGQNIAQALDAPDLKSILILADGLNVNGTDLVQALNEFEHKNIVVTGGLAGDGDRFKETWVIYEGKIYKNSIAAIAFYGDDIKVGYASKGGWDIFGPERHITRSKDNILYELDDKPALELYKKYLGDRADQLPSAGLLFPLAIRKNQNDKHLVRTILAVNEEEQSLTFAGDMPTGYLAQLMKANFDRLISSAGDAGKQAGEEMASSNSEPVLAIAISCVGRRLLLGERTEEETEYTLEAMSDNTKQVGFYSYGELSPLTPGTCELHNQTMTLTTICEK
jgi:hypothetical protein